MVILDTSELTCTLYTCSASMEISADVEPQDVAYQGSVTCFRSLGFTNWTPITDISFYIHSKRQAACEP